MLGPIQIPPSTPAHKVPGYAMPDTLEPLLSWSFVEEQMTAALYYWLGTIYPDGRPHNVPVWGIWHNQRIHFDGSPHTAWAKHLRRDPRIVVHLPDAQKVVIIEGTASMIGDDALTTDEWTGLDTIFQTKYNVKQGSPYWCVQPQKVLAWNGATLHTMTRWQFS